MKLCRSINVNNVIITPVGTVGRLPSVILAATTIHCQYYSNSAAGYDYAPWHTYIVKLSVSLPSSTGRHSCRQMSAVNWQKNDRSDLGRSDLSAGHARHKFSIYFRASSEQQIKWRRNEAAAG